MDTPELLTKALGGPAAAAQKPLKRAPRLAVETADKTLRDALSGENVDALLKSLSEKERLLFYQALNELRETGEAESEQLWHIDYAKRPPTIEEFVDDDYWVGQVTRPSEDNEGLFPTWKKVLCDDFNIDSRLHNVVFTGSLGVGKCSPAGTLVIMYDGSVKPVEKIQAGDRLMGDDSTPRTVSKTFTGSGKIYEIYPAKGIPFRVSENHILCLKTSTSDSVQEVSVSDFVSWPRKERHTARVYRTGVEWPASTVPLDPYWLGLWLGDGSTCRVELTTMDTVLRDYWLAYGKKFGCSVIEAGQSRKKGKARTYTLTVHSRGNVCKNPLKLLLNSLGMCFSKSTDDKRIPKAYLVNNRQVRLELLAGLMDTDGSSEKSHGVYSITLGSKKLSDDTVFLARSLGYYAQTKIKIVNAVAYYKTIISGAYDVPCKLTHKQSPRKRKGCVGRYGATSIDPDPSKSKFAVIPLEEEDTYYGFELDGNHRYLLGDFTVTHNSFCTAIVLLYRIVLALHLRNAHNLLGLSKGTNLQFVVMSVTQRAVHETLFGDLINFMSNSPYFTKDRKFDPDMKYVSSRIPLAESTYLTAGSKSQHVLGRNTLIIALDEGNRRLEKTPNQAAYALYGQFKTRQTNRFQRISGYLPALTLVSSSTEDESSFTERLCAEIAQVADPKTQKVYRAAVYHIRRHKLTLSGRWFRVAHGIQNVEPRVLRGLVTEEGAPLEGQEIEQVPTGARIELVPDDYLPVYQRNCVDALQSMSGISTGASYRFFSNTIDLETAAENAARAGSVNPCQMDRIPLSDEDEFQIHHRLEHKTFLVRRLGRVIPMRDPEAPRFAHIDLATENQAGVSICHVVGNKLVDGLYDTTSGKLYSQFRPILEYDFILAIIRGEKKKISIQKIQNLFFWLREQCGYRFGLVTADQFQSVQVLQLLENNGFKTGNLSLILTKVPYLAYREALAETRIRQFRHSILMQEAEQLLDGRTKIEHPENSTDDIIQSAAGAAFNALTEGGTSASGAITGSGGFSGTDRTEQAVEPPPMDLTPKAPERPIKMFEL